MSDDQVVADLSKHTADQCRAAIDRAKQLLPESKHHHLSLNVVSMLTATAVKDTLIAYNKEFPQLKTTFEQVLNGVLSSIHELAMASKASDVARERGLVK